MSIDSDFFDRITDKLVANLKADVLLDRDLPGAVQVYKSPQQVSTENHVVFVWRANIDEYAYSMGGAQQVKIWATWNVAALTRTIGDPEELERQVSILAANIVRHFGAHVQESGYWEFLQPQGSSADTVRTTENQTWELELMPIQLKWETTL